MEAPKTVAVPLGDSAGVGGIKNRAALDWVNKKFVNPVVDTVVLLHVADIPKKAPGVIGNLPVAGGSPEFLKAHIHDKIEKAKVFLLDYQKVCKSEKVNASIKILVNERAQGILKFAKEIGATHLVMGTDGDVPTPSPGWKIWRSSTEESLTARVAKEAPCDVFLVTKKQLVTWHVQKGPTNSVARAVPDRPGVSPDSAAHAAPSPPSPAVPIPSAPPPPPGGFPSGPVAFPHASGSPGHGGAYPDVPKESAGPTTPDRPEAPTSEQFLHRLQFLEDAVARFRDEAAENKRQLQVAESSARAAWKEVQKERQAREQQEAAVARLNEDAEEQKRQLQEAESRAFVARKEAKAERQAKEQQEEAAASSNQEVTECRQQLQQAELRALNAQKEARKEQHERAQQELVVARLKEEVTEYKWRLQVADSRCSGALKEAKKEQEARVQQEALVSRFKKEAAESKRRLEEAESRALDAQKDAKKERHAKEQHEAAVGRFEAVAGEYKRRLQVAESLARAVQEVAMEEREARARREVAALYNQNPFKEMHCRQQPFEY